MTRSGRSTAAWPRPRWPSGWERGGRDASGRDIFGAGAHEKAIRRFIRASRAVRDHLTTALPARVLGARPFDAASGSGQVGALQRELAKQRRGLGVRQLLAQYGELITQVMPCVLVS